MWGIAAIILAALILLVAFVQVKSPGRPAPLVDAEGNTVAGSISEKVFIEVNGLKQGMYIQSKNPANPVMLYLHGGMPDFFLTNKYPTGLEDEFTMVWWEQRGSGISYSPEIPAGSITLEQMILDTLAVTDYLRQRFGQDKIYLMGHSGGTFIGIQTVARAPEKYYAYIGVAQMANQLESERRAYDFMLKRFEETGNTDMVNKLKAAPVTLSNGTPEQYLKMRDMAMHSLGIGTTHDMNSVITGIFLPSFVSPIYTLMEKINLWRGKSQSGVASLWKEMIRTDLSKTLPEITIPVYFFEGQHDYTCTYSVAKEYFATLKAPVKGFYTFEQSAHSPMFEEPMKMQQILREDVLNGANRLADPQ